MARENGGHTQKARAFLSDGKKVIFDLRFRKAPVQLLLGFYPRERGGRSFSQPDRVTPKDFRSILEEGFFEKYPEGSSPGGNPLYQAIMKRDGSVAFTFFWGGRRQYELDPGSARCAEILLNAFEKFRQAYPEKPASPEPPASEAFEDETEDTLAGNGDNVGKVLDEVLRQKAEAEELVSRVGTPEDNLDGDLFDEGVVDRRL